MMYRPNYLHVNHGACVAVPCEKTQSTLTPLGVSLCTWLLRADPKWKATKCTSLGVCLISHGRTHMCKNGVGYMVSIFIFNCHDR